MFQSATAVIFFLLFRDTYITGLQKGCDSFITLLKEAIEWAVMAVDYTGVVQLSAKRR